MALEINFSLTAANSDISNYQFEMNLCMLLIESAPKKLRIKEP